MDKVSKKTILLNGIFKQNSVFVLTLGMCPTLAVTTSLEGAIGMGFALLFVLIFSNISISLVRKIVPNEIRIPVYIVIIATFVTIVEMLLNAYLPDLYDKLGVFVSLIVVNCIVLGRAEAFASKNNPIDSLLDAIGSGLGFVFALMIVATIREILGVGTLTIWGSIQVNFMPIFTALGIKPAPFFVSNPGAFIVLAFLIGIFQSVAIYRKKMKSRKVA
ncbi:MAG: electron transport complex subunit E [Bacilli bacterium]|nr:electron transport complex subunit E [Bacilli bacterium]